MPHWLTYYSLIFGRLIAAVIACICFYVAFFMYEDEEGNWQNRLEEVWIQIDDRARLIEARTFAVFNRVAALLVDITDWIFGKRLFSFRTVTASINLSLAFMLMALATVVLLLDSTMLLEAVPVFCVGLGLLVLVFLPAVFPTKWTLAISSAPIIVFALRIPRFRPYGNLTMDKFWEIMLLSIVYSLISDIFAITIIRSLFRVISWTTSTFRMIKAVSILFAVPIVIVAFPMLGILIVLMLPGNYDRTQILGAASLIGFALNVSTFVYCVGPVALLAAIVLHRMLWPTLGRGTYAALRYRLLSNKKFLLGLGCLLMSIALNLEKIAIKDFVKLLG
jgi:hypothetical protein